MLQIASPLLCVIGGGELAGDIERLLFINECDPVQLERNNDCVKDNGTELGYNIRGALQMARYNSRNSSFYIFFIPQF